MFQCLKTSAFLRSVLPQTDFIPKYTDCIKFPADGLQKKVQSKPQFNPTYSLNRNSILTLSASFLKNGSKSWHKSEPWWKKVLHACMY